MEFLNTVQCTDAVSFLKSLPDACLDAVITDPPYAEVNRPYGRLTEAEWWELIVEGVVPEVRRCLKPIGSAVFIIQPNSRKVGSMRGWVFEFQAWVCREWNMVQDAWWWNFTAMPTAHSQEKNGLMRPSVKPCVWCGPDTCWRGQDAVLWSESDATAAKRIGARADRQSYPSGHSMNESACLSTCEKRGGVTPFNVIPIANAESTDSAGSNGHGAGTPLPLMRWWTRYIVPPGGLVCDPFMGSGTGALAAIAEGRDFTGCERDEGYCEIARRRIADAKRALQPQLLEAA